MSHLQSQGSCSVWSSKDLPDFLTSSAMYLNSGFQILWVTHIMIPILHCNPAYTKTYHSWNKIYPYYLHYTLILFFLFFLTLLHSIPFYSIPFHPLHSISFFKCKSQLIKMIFPHISRTGPAVSKILIHQLKGMFPCFLQYFTPKFYGFCSIRISNLPCWLLT